MSAWDWLGSGSERLFRRIVDFAMALGSHTRKRAPQYGARLALLVADNNKSISRAPRRPLLKTLRINRGDPLAWFGRKQGQTPNDLRQKICAHQHLDASS
jgi:hypothetical protein